jgi:RNA polymerase sigma-70 factor, ECF subfamily
LRQPLAPKFWRRKIQDLTPQELAAAVEASVRHAFPDRDPTRRERDRYVASLHIEDLALAAACAHGRDAAWDRFVLELRPVLYRAADALDPTGGARELADSLYADLYGIKEVDGKRRSLFRYFHGRSSLATWLRAVLAQRYVDSLRARKRAEPLEDHEPALPQHAAQVSDPDRELLVPLLQQALQTAIDGLAAKDRLRLRSYYEAQLTLAEIGRIAGEHEATVSRHLSRTRRSLRSAIEGCLRERGLDETQIARAFELALEDPAGLNLQQVFDSTVDRKETPPDRSR